MSRILKRPMFRLGGSTEGITSGLDAPNINASRVGYWKGSMRKKKKFVDEVRDAWEGFTEEDKKNYPEMFVGEHLDDEMARNIMEEQGWSKGTPSDQSFPPMDDSTRYSTEHDDQVGTGGTGINSINTRKEGGDTAARGTDMAQNVRDRIAMIEKLKEEHGVYPEKERGAPGSVSSMLMNFGLNLAAQPGGDLVGAIGRAGSPALQKFQESRQLERLRKSKDKKEMIDSLVRSEYGLEEERIAAQGAIDEALINAQGKSEKAFQFNSQFDLVIKTHGEIAQLKKDIAEGKDPDGKKATELEGKEKALETITGANKLLEAIYNSPGMEIRIEDITDDFLEKEGRHPTTEELLKILSGKKDGGRIGYQIGGEVEEITESVDTVAGPDQTQDLTYMELRNRLPREISNDIVQLLSASKQALMDFANIQTQQDVDNFNQAYNVDLVLPQEG